MNMSTNLSDASTSTEVSTSNLGVQTPNCLSANTPQKLKLQEKLNEEIRLRKESVTREKDLLTNVTALSLQLADRFSIDYCMKLCKENLKPTLFMLVDSQMKNKKKGGQRYSNEIKQFALNIYFLGPKIYKLLQNSFSLPTSRTLRNVTSKYELNSGLNDFIFNFLSFKIRNYKPEALDCVLCAGEMALKTNLFYNVSKDKIIGFHESISNKKYEPAKYALVLMIRGINYNWEQPIAYFLVSSSCTGTDLKDIILTTICRLQSIKLNIKAFVTDQGSNFSRFAKDLYVSPNRPFFEVEKKQIFYIFNPPHLIKSTRNMLFKYNFQINTNIISKDHIVAFYDYDSKCNHRSAPKLKHFHIYPGPFEKMRVYLATQLFSASVAAGMSIALVSNILPPTAQFTIDFINDMDKLFDIFNSSKFPNLKSFRHPFKNTSEQIYHLNKMASIFRNMKVLHKFKSADETKHINFINGWLISISSLQMLYSSLNPAKNINYVLYTNQINLDCLENLFCTLRQQQGNNFNPTPIQLSWAFKKMFCLNYFQHSAGANFIQDLDQILCSEIAPDELFNSQEPPKNPFKFKSISIGTIDYRNLDIPEGNTFTYVCGYLMKKCLEKHICQDCINYARFQNQLDQYFLLPFLKAYSTTDISTFGNLMMHHNDFYNFIFELENIFIETFPSISVENGVGAKLRLYFGNIPFSHPCKLFDKSFLLNLFIRFRIFTALKFLNRSLVSEKKLKNRTLTVVSHL